MGYEYTPNSYTSQRVKNKKILPKEDYFCFNFEKNLICHGEQIK